MLLAGLSGRTILQLHFQRQYIVCLAIAGSQQCFNLLNKLNIIHKAWGIKSFEFKVNWDGWLVGEQSDAKYSHNYLTLLRIHDPEEPWNDLRSCGL